MKDIPTARNAPLCQVSQDDDQLRSDFRFLCPSIVLKIFDTLASDMKTDLLPTTCRYLDTRSDIICTAASLHLSPFAPDYVIIDDMSAFAAYAFNPLM